VNCTLLPDIVQEAQRILDAADEREIVLRLFGGLAVRFHCPSATHSVLERKYADIDFMSLRKQSRDLKKLFGNLGYSPREKFNAFQGDTRLIFNDLEHNRRIDIFLETFEMCHRLDLRDRLLIDRPTISLADLLATKLQVVEITEREYKDVIALVHDHEIGDSDLPETINGAYLGRICADDWGIYKTFTINLANIISALPQYQLDSQYQDVARKRLQNLQEYIESMPKTVRWKIRGRVGEKVRWYDLPEQDKEIVDSHIFKVD
jgi:hypothetical protein